jgi:hypothetical protein
MARNEIIVGLDDSPSGEAALRWAAQQVLRADSLLRAIHVFDWPYTLSTATPGVDISPLTMDRTESAYTSITKVFKEIDPRPDWSLEFVRGKPGPVLVRESKGRPTTSSRNPGACGTRSAACWFDQPLWPEPRYLAVPAEAFSAASRMFKSVTVSRYSRPAMSGQYSSATPEAIPSARASTKAISRPNARERICSRSARFEPGKSALQVSEPQHSRPKVKSCPTPRILSSPDLAGGSVHNGELPVPEQPTVGHLGGVQLLSHHRLHRIPPKRHNRTSPGLPCHSPDFRISSERLWRQRSCQHVHRAGPGHRPQPVWDCVEGRCRYAGAPRDVFNSDAGHGWHDQRAGAS